MSITRKGREGTIEVIALSHSISSPIDVATGLPRARRVHQPVIITKEIDAASVKLYQALVTNEKLKKVVINFWQPAGDGAKGGSGTENNFYKIELTNATIVNVSQNLLNTQDRSEINKPVSEKIELVYEKIQWDHLGNSPVSTTDDWRTLKELEMHDVIKEAEWEGDKIAG